MELVSTFSNFWRDAGSCIFLEFRLRMAFSVAIAKGTATLVCSRKFLAMLDCLWPRTIFPLEQSPQSFFEEPSPRWGNASRTQICCPVDPCCASSCIQVCAVLRLKLSQHSLKVSTSSDSMEARNCLCSQQRSCPVSFMGFVNKRIGLSSPKPPTKKLTICSIFLCCSAKCRCIALLRDFASRFGNNIELHSNQFVCSDCCDSIRYHHEAIGPNRTFYSARLPKINSTLRHADSGTLLTHFLRAFTAESILLASQFHPKNSLLS